MRTKFFTLLMAALMLITLNLHASTVVVGPTGAYPSISLAIAGQNALGSITEPFLIELQQAYSRPDTIVGVNGASATNTVTIRPEAAATDINVTGGGLIVWRLQNCQYIHIDGRPGGIGASVLTLTADTLTTDRPAALSVTNSSYCSINYVTLKAATINNPGDWVNGPTIAPTVGVVTIASGVANLTIDHCNITGLNNVKTPTIGVISIGSISAVNSGLVISNNNFYDIYSRDLSKCTTVASTGVGILLSDYTTASTISGNSFYQTVARTLFGNSNGGKSAAISIQNATGEGFIIKNNYIGGSLPECGGTNRFSFTIGNNTGFNGIYLSTPATASARSYIYGNTIKNIFLYASSPIANVYKSAGISINGGKVSVGVKEDDSQSSNLIGDQSPLTVGPTNASIIFMGSGTSGGFAGITFNSIAGSDVIIANNKIAGICVNNFTSQKTASFLGIDILGTVQSSILIENNEIGNSATGVTPTSMSIQNYQVRNCFGIYMNSSGASNTTLIIKNNKINNMYKAADAINPINSQTYVNGIWINTAVLCPVTITGNIISDLAFSNGRVNDTPINWASGITFGSQGPGSIISNNTISNIEGIGAYSLNLMGICLLSTSGAASINVFNNNIYNISSNVTRKLGQYATGLAGILTHATGAVTPTLNVYNNMIRLGNDRSGTELTNALLMAGIRDSVMSTSAAKANYYNNTIYLGGSNVATNDTVPTFGLCLATGTSAIREVINNLIVNVRSNATTGSKHYAIATGGSSSALANLTSDYNNYLASGTDGVLGRFTNKTDAVDLPAIQSYTAGDTQSKNVVPVFVDPSAATPNLHLDQINSLNAHLNFATVLALTDLDLDGDARKGTYRTFGADEFKGPGTGILSTEKLQSFVFVKGNHIVINQITIGEMILVFAVNGQLVKQQLSKTPQISFDLTRGIYVVKVGTKIQKIVI